MTIGDLVKTKASTFMVPDKAAIGLIVDVWLLNNCNWYQVLWDIGQVKAIAERDLELL